MSPHLQTMQLHPRSGALTNMMMIILVEEQCTQGEI